MAKDMHTLPEGTHTITLGVGDLNGLLRGKRIPAEQGSSQGLFVELL